MNKKVLTGKYYIYLLCERVWKWYIVIILNIVEYFSNFISWFFSRYLRVFHIKIWCSFSVALHIFISATLRELVDIILPSLLWCSLPHRQHLSYTDNRSQSPTKSSYTSLVSSTTLHYIAFNKIFWVHFSLSFMLLHMLCSIMSSGVPTRQVRRFELTSVQCIFPIIIWAWELHARIMWNLKSKSQLSRFLFLFFNLFWEEGFFSLLFIL